MKNNKLVFYIIEYLLDIVSSQFIAEEDMSLVVHVYPTVHCLDLSRLLSCVAKDDFQWLLMILNHFENWLRVSTGKIVICFNWQYQSLLFKKENFVFDILTTYLKNKFITNIEIILCESYGIMWISLCCNNTRMNIYETQNNKADCFITFVAFKYMFAKHIF